MVKGKNSTINIKYSGDHINLSAENIFGQLNMDLSNNSNISIENAFGEFNFKTENKYVDLENDFIIGTISYKNIIKSKNSNIKIDIENIFGKVDLKNP